MNLNITLLIEVASFALLLFILTKLLYKPVLELLDKRSKNVEKMLNESQRSREEADQKAKNAQDALDRARREIIEMKESARLETDEARKSILDKAREESRMYLEFSKKELEKEAGKIKKGIRDQVADFSIFIAEKILKREITKKDQAAFLEKTLKEMEREDRT